MAMLEMGRVTLGDVEGQGYAFTRKTAFGKSYHGIFFSDEEEADLEALQEEDELTFVGPVYYRRRSGSYRKKDEEEMPVSVVNVTSTRMGDRVDFEAVENPDEVEGPRVVRSR